MQQLNAMGWVRLVIYTLSALVGLATVITATLGFHDIAALMGTIAGAGAAITGGTATFNLPKAPDQKPLAGLDLAAVLAALPAIIAAGKQLAESTATVPAQPGYEGRHREPEVTDEVELPVYSMETTGDA